MRIIDFLNKGRGTYYSVEGEDKDLNPVSYFEASKVVAEVHRAANLNSAWIFEVVVSSSEDIQLRRIATFSEGKNLDSLVEGGGLAE